MKPFKIDIYSYAASEFKQYDPQDADPGVPQGVAPRSGQDDNFRELERAEDVV